MPLDFLGEVVGQLIAEAFGEVVARGGRSVKSQWRAFRHRGRNVRRRRRRPVRLPCLELPSLTAGQLGTTRGFVHALSSPLRSPITGRACLAWSLRFTPIGWPGSPIDAPISEEQHAEDFLLTLDRSQLLVLGSGAALDLEGASDGQTPLHGFYSFEGALRRRGFSSDDGLFAWEERILEPGAFVQASGRVTERVSLGSSEEIASYRDAPMRPALVASLLVVL